MSPLYGSIVVIKRSGQDGSVFSLIREECLMGRSEDCDIRIQLLDVSSEHARLDVDPVSKEVVMTSVGKNGVKVGDVSIPLGEKITLKDKDVFQISDRFFRFESPLAPVIEGRKRVSFGPVISPEYIDKSLPPSTPVKKGAVPNSLPMTPLSHIKRRMPKLRGATPQHGPILESQEEEKPVGVLVRHKNDTPRIKESSGSRTSPRMDNSAIQIRQTSSTPKRPASLSKNPSRFYGASAAKTPKGAKKPLPKTPKTISKTPRKVSTKIVKTPMHLKASAKKSWADVLKKNVGKTPRAIRVARETQLEDEKRRVQYDRKKNLKKKSTQPKKTLEGESSTDRHAQSPEDIVIHRRRSVHRSIKAMITTPKSSSPSSKKEKAKSSSLSESKAKRQSVSPSKQTVDSPSSKKEMAKSSPLPESKAKRQSVSPSKKRVDSPSSKKGMAKSSPLPESKAKRQSVSPSKKTAEVVKRGRSKSVSSAAKSSDESHHRRSQSSSAITPNLKTDELDHLSIVSSATRRKKRFSLVTSESPSSDEAQSSLTSKRSRLSRSPSKKWTSSASKSSKSPSASLRSQELMTPSSTKRSRPRKAQSPSKSNSAKKRALSSSPNDCQDIETPSSGRRGRQQQAQSSSKRSNSVSKLVAASSPASGKSKELNTPSSTKRSRTSMASSNALRKTRSSSTGTIKTPNSETPSTSRGDSSSKTILSAKSTLSSKKVKAKRSKSLSNLSISNRLKENDPRQSLSGQDILALSKNKRYSTPMTKIRKSFVKESPLGMASKDSSLDSIILPTSSKTPANSPANGISPSNINRNLSRSVRESLGSFENSPFFDFDAVKTPNIPIQALVSPLLSGSIHEEGGALKSLRSKPATRMSLNTDAMREYQEVSRRRRHSIDRINMHDRRSARLSPNKKSSSKMLAKEKTRHVQKSPKSSYDNFVGIKELLKTPKKFEDMLQEGDLEALYASPEFNVLTTEKRESFLKKIQMVNTVTLNRKLSLSNVKPKSSNVLKRRSLECNIDLFGSNRTEIVEKVKQSRTSLNSASDEVENESPMSTGRRRSSKTVADSKAKSKFLGKDKKALPTKLREHVVGDQTDFSVEAVLETSSSDLNNLNEDISSSTAAENLSSIEELNDKQLEARDNEAKLVTKDDLAEKEPPAKRSTRSKTTKKAAGAPEVSSTPPKRATRSRNKSENEKTKTSKVLKNEEEVESKPTPKRSTRGRKNAKVDAYCKVEIIKLDSSKVTQKNSDSDQTEEKQTKKRSRTRKNEQLDTESVERPKTRGRRLGLLEAASSDASPPPTKKNRRGQKNAASEVELKQSETESSVERPVSDKTNKQSERGIQTNSSDSDEPPTSSDQIRLLPKRSSRRNQKSDTSNKSPAKRATRNARAQNTDSKDPEVINEVSDKESTKVRRTRRGRNHSPQVAEVIESAKEELAPPTPKQRRTRRAAAAKSPEVAAPSASTKDDKTESVQAPTTRKGRKKKEHSESSDDAPPKDESSTANCGAKTRRKRNVAQSETVTETESSPPKRGRRTKKQENNVDKTESPIKRVTRSRAKK